MSTVDERLRAHYARASLPDTSMRELLALHADAADPAGGDEQADSSPTRPTLWSRILPTRAMPRARASTWRAAFACLALVALSTLLYRSGYQSGERLGAQATLGQRTMSEVAMNHRTRLKLEYRADSLDTLDARMDQLPFALGRPARLDDALQVVGSRYCSLAGHLAAHVKFRDPADGRQVSLFVTSLGTDLRRLDGEHADVDGVGVALWREDGLLYAMARHD